MRPVSVLWLLIECVIEPTAGSEEDVGVDMYDLYGGSTAKLIC